MSHAHATYLTDTDEPADALEAQANPRGHVPDYVVSDISEGGRVPTGRPQTEIVKKLLELEQHPGKWINVSGPSLKTMRSKAMAVRRAYNLPPRCFVVREMEDGSIRIWRRKETEQ